ncbi:PEP-CTERM sorting domain-containing protein [Microcystis aeruginosa]|uniref:PEP-CTERM sorting domain-containing protein n=1 Tax=Microcystis aeruginosa TaxID=1126 RepID=UPI000A78DD96|nr:PEP-CTERM sorting domain-containing protein [Microcystis aeruginosa]
MTTNKLTKILSGVATLGIATAMATPAQASTFPVPLVGGNGFVNATIAFGGLSIGATVYDSVELGDQLFSDFSFGGDVGVGDELRFILNEEVWTVNFTEKTSLGVLKGTLEYNVKIVAISTPPLVFDTIRFDTDISGPGGSTNYLATKEVFTLGGTPLITLTSTNGSEAFGSILSFNASPIKVVDTFTSGDNGKSRLQSSTNDFTQDLDPPSSIPEPGTILGLLAVGGLGLVSSFKKQK